MLRAIIVEDEKRNAHLLQRLIEEVAPQVQIVAVEQSIEGGLTAIQQQQPQLLFLDIKMPQGTGFDLLDKLPQIDFDIIFTTAFDDYAIKAIKFSALDYLLKPIDKEELSEAIQKVWKKQSTNHRWQQIDLLLQSISQQNETTDRAFEKIAFPTLKGYRFLLVQHIVYCEAEGAYAKVYLSDGSYLMVSRNLKEIADLLSEHAFFRVHRSFLVNMRHVNEYIKGEGGQIHLSGGATVPVSQRRKEAFIRFFSKMR
ncbi:MAG: LytTR family DNA-binding domain-containing protein [Bacteroidota bacterium]